MTSQLQTEITTGSELCEVTTLIERLRSDPEVVSRIHGRQAAFLIAMREALMNAITHGNRRTPSKKVHVRCSCEPDNSLLISIRDEGDGFDPSSVPIPKETGGDQRRGIRLMTSFMDEVQFRRNGTKVYMRMTKLQDPQQ
jgi:anti-sigma regulatory factor (Ser/Thr protein kinase)